MSANPKTADPEYREDFVKKLLVTYPNSTSTVYGSTVQANNTQQGSQNTYGYLARMLGFRRSFGPGGQFGGLTLFPQIQASLAENMRDMHEAVAANGNHELELEDDIRLMRQATKKESTAFCSILKDDQTGKAPLKPQERRDATAGFLVTTILPRLATFGYNAFLRESNFGVDIDQDIAKMFKESMKQKPASEPKPKSPSH